MEEIAISQLAAIIASMLVSVVGFASSKTIIAWRNAKEARRAADITVFDAALATADLNTVGTMLRDKFGSVDIETFLNDPITQDKVARSLKRLAEVVNQPASDTVPTDASAEQNDQSNEDALGNSIPPNLRTRTIAYIDNLDAPIRRSIAAGIASIAETTELRLHGVSLWTALAGARRELEKLILPKVSSKLEFLSPRMFQDPQLRSAMGIFLSVANRAIHGDEVSLERAERAVSALQFVGTRLQTIEVD